MYGFTPAMAEPSRVTEVRARGGAISHALGVVQPVYDTLVKNMRATEGLELLQGKELQQRRISELLAAANTQQKRLDTHAASDWCRFKDLKPRDTQ